MMTFKTYLASTETFRALPRYPHHTLWWLTQKRKMTSYDMMKMNAFFFLFCKF